MGRILAAGLGLVALAGPLVLPLVLTCRTYRSLTLNAPAPCCAGASACPAGPGGQAPVTLASCGVDCPFCKAASPFRHASPSTFHAPAAHRARLVSAPTLSPRSVPPGGPDLTSASPRAPPLPA